MWRTNTKDGPDYIGSTTGLLKFTQTDSTQEYIVATETGILHQMMKASPEKTFIPAPPNNSQPAMIARIWNLIH